MPKIPDFSKFDLQSIISSVKSMINPETGTPRVMEGDPIGTKVVQISTLLQNVTRAQEQSAKDLNEINSLMKELYKDIEAFRKLEVELKQKQVELEAREQHLSQAQTNGQSAAAGVSTGSASQGAATPGKTNVPPAQPSGLHEGAISEKSPLEQAATSHPSKINIEAEEEELKKDDQSPLDPNRGTSRPSDRD